MYILSSVRFVTRPIISGSIELQINKSVILSCWCGRVFGFAPIFYDWCVKGWTFTQNKRMTFLNMYKTLNFKSILKKYIQDLSPPPKKKSGCEGFSQDIPNLRQLSNIGTTQIVWCTSGSIQDIPTSAISKHGTVCNTKTKSLGVRNLVMIYPVSNIRLLK